MSKEKRIEEMAEEISDVWNNKCQFATCKGCKYSGLNDDKCQEKLIADHLIAKGYRKQSEWISVEERLPNEDEYLTHHNDGLDTLKRITVAYMTDTIEYTIGCYDGYKWMNQLGNKKINDVVAWKPFELYEAPKGGAE